jgi:hypothetical protein
MLARAGHARELERSSRSWSCGRDRLGTNDAHILAGMRGVGLGRRAPWLARNPIWIPSAREWSAPPTHPRALIGTRTGVLLRTFAFHALPWASLGFSSFTCATAGLPASTTCPPRARHGKGRGSPQSQSRVRSLVRALFSRTHVALARSSHLFRGRRLRLLVVVGVVDLVPLAVVERHLSHSTL